MQQVLITASRTASAQASSSTHFLHHLLPARKNKLDKFLTWLGGMALLFALAPAAPGQGATVPTPLSATAATTADPAAIVADDMARVQDFVARDMRSVVPVQADAGAAPEGYRALSAGGFELTFGVEGGFHALLAAAPNLGPDGRPDGRPDTTPGEAPAWQWGLRPQAVGVGNRLTMLGAPLSQGTHADTLTNAYAVPWLLPGKLPGGLVEWFANGSGGLRQTFTLAARPHGPATAPLVLQLAQAGDLRATPSADGRSLIVRTANGQAVLTYTGLHVFDAAGRSLPARFRPNTGPGVELAVEVADAGAVYPLVIDPLLGTAATPAWSAAGENAGDSFGYALAGAGDVNSDGFADLAIAAPGANGSTGKVYLFYGSASGLNATSAWTAAGENTGDRFGHSVTGVGDVNGDGYPDLAVGASGYNSSTGKVYVFHGGAAGLSAVPDWSTDGEHAGDKFGWCVAGAGDVDGAASGSGYADLAVGASGYSSSTGKVYVFHGGATGLSGSAATPAWSAAGEHTGDAFGASLDGAGDVNGDGYTDLAVGAYAFSSGMGMVYVFQGGPTGLSAGPAWSTEGEHESGNFGWAVAGANDVNGDGYADLAVSADGYDRSLGKVYVFHGSGTGISGTAATAAWSAVGEDIDNFFGWSVAGVGDVNGDGYADLAVGASWYGSTGKTYIFQGSAAGLSGAAWSPAWSAGGEDANDFFGYAVAGAGDVNGDGYADLAVGATQYGSNMGKAYVFHGRAARPGASPTWRATGENWSNMFGYTVAGAGDVNGDGYADLAVGARCLSSLAGNVYVFHGGAGGLNSVPAWNATGGHVCDNFGSVVVGAGDVNGDGYADLAVGHIDESGSGTGHVSVFHGGAAGLDATPAWSTEGETAGNYFGAALARIGDVNGDGYDDLAVAAGGYNSGKGKGKVYIFHGSATGLSGTAAGPAWSATDENSLDWFGTAVAGAGDVNGDGYADLAVSAVDSSHPGTVYIFLGSATGLGATPVWSAEGEHTGDSFGQSLDGAGDLNGDGYGDLAVGASWNSSGTGKVYVFHGDAAGLNAVPSWSATGEHEYDFFGVSVAGAGDVNGDGYADLAVSAPDSGNGIVHVFFGGTNGLRVTPDRFATGENVSDGFGDTVEGVGDVNGDGYSDLAVSAPWYSRWTGRVYVFNGSSSQAPAEMQERGDFGATTQEVPLLLNVLANDREGNTGGLAVRNATPPVTSAEGGVTGSGVTSLEQNQVRYTPAAGFSGLARFRYTMQEGTQWANEVGVAVRVFPAAILSGPPQKALLGNPAAANEVVLNTPAGVTSIKVPAGAIVAPAPNVTYGFVYAEFKAPAEPVPAAIFSYGGRAFALILFAGDQELGSYVFGSPLEITLAYDPDLVTNTGDLRLYFYDVANGQWSNAGLRVLGVDEVQHTFTVSVPHLAKFAVGLRAPGRRDSTANWRLFLPAVQRP